MSCGKTSASPTVGSKDRSSVEALLFGARAVPGKIEAFLNNGIDVDNPMFARAFARVQQHVLDDGIRPLAVLHDFVEIATQCVSQFLNVRTSFIVKWYAL